MKTWWSKFFLLQLVGLFGFIFLNYAFPELDTRHSMAAAFAIECFAVYIIGLWYLFYDDENEK